MKNMKSAKGVIAIRRNVGVSTKKALCIALAIALLAALLAGCGGQPAPADTGSQINNADEPAVDDDVPF